MKHRGKPEGGAARPEAAAGGAGTPRAPRNTFARGGRAVPDSCFARPRARRGLRAGSFRHRVYSSAMATAPLARIFLVAGFGLALCSSPAWPGTAPHPQPGASIHGPETDAVPDLPVPDVLRLTDEARWLFSERKLEPLSPASARARLAHPTSILADS